MVDIGLDSLPREYPCQLEGTAVMEDGRIDCDRTIAVAGCPWAREYDAAGEPGESVIGMLGTYCWFRGKVGEWALRLLEEVGEEAPYSFYGGDDEAEPGVLPPDECLGLAKWMEDRGELYAKLAIDEYGSDEASDQVEVYTYAIWWLRFAAQHANGTRAWW